MSVITPESAEEVCKVLREAAGRGHSIRVLGRDTKMNMAGPIEAAEVSISTLGLSRVVEYEPRDLTVSVEAGCSFLSLQKLLEQNGQMIALDPPFLDRGATIGGVIAANTSGPMRRGYGTARDLVIGMSFATLDGKLVKSGGMVVKNVAGLDMAKLMIGSFGTLAVITSVNFRIHSLPESTRTFLFTFAQLEDALAKRNQILTSYLQPIAVDLISPSIAVRVSQKGFVLAVRAAGSARVLQRYQQELQGELLSESGDAVFWKTIQEFPSDFMQRQREGIILRVSTTLSDVGPVLKQTAASFISRVANGVTYLYFASWSGAARVWKSLSLQSWPCVVEYAPQSIRERVKLWHESDTGPEQAFVTMKEIKHMFDPKVLLNRNRLYGRI